MLRFFPSCNYSYQNEFALDLTDILAIHQNTCMRRIQILGFCLTKKYGRGSRNRKQSVSRERMNENVKSFTNERNYCLLQPWLHIACLRGTKKSPKVAVESQLDLLIPI